MVAPYVASQAAWVGIWEHIVWPACKVDWKW